jgi:hypothetical protein
MRVAPGIEARLESKIATDCARNIFKSEKRVIFISVRGETEVLGASHSRYNLGFVPYAIRAACELVKGGFTSS